MAFTFSVCVCSCFIKGLTWTKLNINDSYHIHTGFVVHNCKKQKSFMFLCAGIWLVLCVGPYPKPRCWITIRTDKVVSVHPFLQHGGLSREALQEAEKSSLSAPAHQSLWQLCGLFGSQGLEWGGWTEAYRRQSTRLLYCQQSIVLTLACITHSVSPKAILCKPFIPDRAVRIL